MFSNKLLLISIVVVIFMAGIIIACAPSSLPPSSSVPLSTGNAVYVIKLTDGTARTIQNVSNCEVVGTSVLSNGFVVQCNKDGLMRFAGIATEVIRQ